MSSDVPAISIPRDKATLLEFAKSIESPIVKALVVGMVRSMTPEQIDSLAEKLERAVNGLRRGESLADVLRESGVSEDTVSRVTHGESKHSP